MVGAFDWFDPDPIATVVVKRTYSFAGRELVAAEEQKPLSIADTIVERSVSYGWDFAPYKPKADVLVVGEACGEPGKPKGELVARFSVGKLEREVLAVARTPADRIPLRERHLLSADGTQRERVGPSAIAAAITKQRSFEDDFDYSVFNAAPAAQRPEAIEPGEEVKLVGVSPDGEIAFRLPEEAPRVRLVWKGAAQPVELQMFADTLWIDATAKLCVVLWRGMTATPRASSVAMLCVTMEPGGEPRSWDEILRPAARGWFSMSAHPGEASNRPKGEEETDRIAEARFDFATEERAPEPTLSLEAYAAISAELAEQRAPRAEVLARSELDEQGWLLEERGWLEAMAERAMAGDGTVAARYGELFVAAQDALAAPHEAERTVADYAEIAVAIEVSEDLPRELEDRKMRLAEWLRWDRRVRREAAENAAFAEDLEREMAAAWLRSGGAP